MAFTVPSYGAIRETILNAQLGLRPDLAVDSDSDNYIRASGFSSATEGLYQHQSWIVRQIFPDQADTDMLELHCAQRYIRRKQAVPATGNVRLTGAAGTVVPSGTPITLSGSSVGYATTAEATVGISGTVDVAAACTLPGTVGNITNNTAVSIATPPIGLDGDAVLLTMDSGADVESHASLLARLLDVIRRPTAGGNNFDWRRWALEVDGVAEAFVYDLRRGLGTVDVAILSETGLPSQALLDAVTAHVNSLRPVGLRGWSIVGPDALALNVSGQVRLDGSRSLAQVKADYTTAVNAYCLAQPPGTEILKSWLEALLSDTAGVRDRILLSPSANIAPVVSATQIQWVRVASVAVELMP